MTEKQLDELFPEMTLNKNSRARTKCLVVYLRKKGYQRKEVAELLRIDEDTVTNYTRSMKKAAYKAYWRKIITNQKANWSRIQSS